MWGSTFAYWRSFALVAFGAALWVTGAMIVAFPGEISTLDFGSMFAAFLSDFMHPVSVLFLWVLDVFIVATCLLDGKVAAGGARTWGWISGALVLFVLVGIIIPHANPAICTTHALGVGLTAMVLVVVIRGLSYVAAQQDRPI